MLCGTRVLGALVILVLSAWLARLVFLSNLLSEKREKSSRWAGYNSYFGSDEDPTEKHEIESDGIGRYATTSVFFAPLQRRKPGIFMATYTRNKSGSAH